MYRSIIFTFVFLSKENIIIFWLNGSSTKLAPCGFCNHSESNSPNDNICPDEVKLELEIREDKEKREG